MREKRLIIERAMATKGVPLSVMSASGMPHSSIASPRTSRIARASLLGTALMPSRYRLWSSTSATKWQVRTGPAAGRR